MEKAPKNVYWSGSFLFLKDSADLTGESSWHPSPFDLMPVGQQELPYPSSWLKVGPAGRYRQELPVLGPL